MLYSSKIALFSLILCFIDLFHYIIYKIDLRGKFLAFRTLPFELDHHPGKAKATRHNFQCWIALFLLRFFFLSLNSLPESRESRKLPES